MKLSLILYFWAQRWSTVYHMQWWSHDMLRVGTLTTPTPTPTLTLTHLPPIEGEGEEEELQNRVRGLALALSGSGRGRGRGELQKDQWFDEFGVCRIGWSDLFIEKERELQNRVVLGPPSPWLRMSTCVSRMLLKESKRA